MADNPVRLINAFIKIFTPRTICNYCRSKQTFKTGFWSGKKMNVYLTEIIIKKLPYLFGFLHSSCCAFAITALSNLFF